MRGENDDKLTAARVALKTVPEPGTFWRHVARGTEYMLCGGCFIENGVVPAIAYRDSAGDVWVRPVVEFMDGRYVQIESPAPEGGS